MKNIKLVIVGDDKIGKKSLLFTYTMNGYPKEYLPTVFDTYGSTVMIDNKPFNLQLWNTSGHEEYKRLRTLSYPKTDIFLVLFSVDNRESLNNAINEWIPEIQHHCPKIPFILVGTKIDLRENENGDKFISKEEGEAKAKEVGAAKYIEVSSMKNENVRFLFEESVRTFLNNENKLVEKSKKEKSSRKPIAKLLIISMIVIGLVAFGFSFMNKSK